MSTGFFYVTDWHALRFRNINAPLIASSGSTVADPIAALLAPRPFGLNENVLKYQDSGHFEGKNASVGLSQDSYKRFSLSASYNFETYRTNVGLGAAAPQSSYSDQGEQSRASFQATHQIYAESTVKFPYKVSASAILDATSGVPYNVVTGIDTNGDGIFNDRPSYATQSDPGVYSTRFGLLSTNVINGNVPRNLGTMPPLVHLDLNVSRSFVLGEQRPSNLRSLTLNARSANLLNHTNVTAVGTTVSSSTFSMPLAAESARRIEFGTRYSF